MRRRRLVGAALGGLAFVVGHLITSTAFRSVVGPTQAAGEDPRPRQGPARSRTTATPRPTIAGTDPVTIEKAPEKLPVDAPCTAAIAEYDAEMLKGTRFESAGKLQQFLKDNAGAAMRTLPPLQALLHAEAVRARACYQAGGGHGRARVGLRFNISSIPDQGLRVLEGAVVKLWPYGADTVDEPLARRCLEHVVNRGYGVPATPGKPSLDFTGWFPWIINIGEGRERPRPALPPEPG